ncbi:MAG: T9SS type A sorting domain-containing protein [Flavobacteriaceae bacterium]
MKKIFLIFIFLFTLQSNAQDPNPDLFRTWHLYYYDHDGDIFSIPEMTPAIYPYLSIAENFDFSGEGACNTFNGIYSSVTDVRLEQAVNYTETNDDCGVTIHTFFETHFFGLMQFGSDYAITQDSEGFVLNLSTPLMDFAEFRSYPLSTKEYSLESLKIYPNPVDDFLKITIPPASLHYKIYSLSGQQLKQGDYPETGIDASSFAPGIYFLAVILDKESFFIKFIKK